MTPAATVSGHSTVGLTDDCFTLKSGYLGKVFKTGKAKPFEGVNLAT